MLDTLITSRTRIKLLLKFFLNPDNAAYLRGLEAEFNESTHGIRMELNRLEEANMITSRQDGKKKIFQVNRVHPLYTDINSMVRKFTGLDYIVEHVTKKLGNLQAVYLAGDMVNGVDTNVIDLVLIGEVDEGYLINLVEKSKSIINRDIRYLVENNYEALNSTVPSMLLWKKDE